MKKLISFALIAGILLSSLNISTYDKEITIVYDNYITNNDKLPIPPINN